MHFISNPTLSVVSQYCDSRLPIFILSVYLALSLCGHFQCCNRIIATESTYF